MTETALPATAAGSRLTHLRRVRGWSQRTLASHAGLSPSTVSRIEAGRRAIRSWAVANALAAALGCALSDLVDVPTQAVPEAAISPPLVRRVLIGTDLRVDATTAFRGWDYLDTLTGLVTHYRIRCAYRDATRILPEAIEQAHAALAVDRPRALREVVGVCLETAVVALGRADTAVAWIAGERAAAAAAEVADPVLRGAAELRRAEVAGREGASARSLAIVEAYLSSEAGVRASDQVCGLLHLQAGLAASHHVARANGTVRRHLELAEALTGSAATGQAPFGLDFNPAVVRRVRLRIALDEADVTAAGAAVRLIDLDQLPAVRERAGYLVDLARMHLLLGRHHQALRLVERAFGMAPEHVATAPTTQALLTDMLAQRLAAGNARMLRSIYQRIQALAGDSRI